MGIKKVKLKSGEVRYKAVLWAHNVQVQSKTFRRKVDARSWLDHEKLEMNKFGPGSVVDRKITLSAFVNQNFVKHTKVRAGTLVEYMNVLKVHVLPKLGDRKLSSLHKYEWQTFFAGLSEKGVSNARINRIRTTISSIYKVAVKLDFVRQNPLTGLEWNSEEKKEIRFWSRDDARRFLSWVRVNRPERFPFYLMAYEAGMRASELIGLKWDCVDLLRRLIIVKRVWCNKSNSLRESTKNKKHRTLPIGIILAEELFKIRRSSDDFVFEPERLSRNYDIFRGWLKRDIKAAGVPDIGLHGFRHSYASHFLESENGSLPELQQILGHADFATTLRYAHLCPSYIEKKAGVVKFEPSGPFPVLQPQIV